MMALELEEEELKDYAEERKRGGTIHSPTIKQVEEMTAKRKSTIRT